MHDLLQPNSSEAGQCPQEADVTSESSTPVASPAAGRGQARDSAVETRKLLHEGVLDLKNSVLGKKDF